MLVAVVPIALLGMMLGFRAGIAAAAYASGVAMLWAVSTSAGDVSEAVGDSLTFFALGGISGYFAKGALGDIGFARARTCTQLRRAIAHGQIGLEYQPIARRSGELLAVEALARWHDPGGGVVPPAEFIPAAESDQATIWELTLHTVEQALRDVRQIADGPVVAVNLSPLALRRRELPEAIGRIIEKSGLPASRLGVEVTETAISGTDEADVIAVLGALQQAGVDMVAIDDFGSGHSSLARLARLPIDTVKIDRSLIADNARAETAALVEGMIKLLHAVGMTVVAEGAEDASTWDWLVESDCDAIQGFELSRPMPLERLRAWLGAREANPSP